MNDGGVCRTAPATPGLLNTPSVKEEEIKSGKRSDLLKYLGNLFSALCYRVIKFLCFRHASPLAQDDGEGHLRGEDSRRQERCQHPEAQVCAAGGPGCPDS